MAHPYPVPHGRTARRLQWSHLPPALRATIERRCGAPVVQARSQDAGFTPGMAAVLETRDGGRHFVKAASVRAQRAFALAYRGEARALASLPPGAPAPRLEWVHDDGEWVVLGIEHVEARAPRRPWRPAELELCLQATAGVAGLLTPPPPAAGLATFAAELGPMADLWAPVRSRLEAGAPHLSPEALPGLARHLDDAAALAAGAGEACAGDTLVHTDLRDDNVLLTGDGRALLCDWSFPVRGAAWVDTVLLLLGPRGDGLDVEALLAAHPTTAGVADAHVDALLALVTGYFLKSAGDPVPPSSPHVRDHQQWEGEVGWAWLAERRGWDLRLAQTRC